MKAEIFLVTYGNDYEFTSYTLQSIAKFGRGFAGITIVVPTRDEQLFKPLADRYGCTLRSYYESESKGFLHHQVCKCEADLWCPRDTDLVVHIDSDCIFKEPFSLDTFLEGGKPILLREHFEDFREYHARYSWKRCAEYALGLDVQWETMVRNPSVFHVDTYERMRRHIEKRHHYPFTQYVLLQRNEFPQTYAEFPTLGAFALEYDADRYQIVTRLETPGPFYLTKPEWVLGEGQRDIWHFGDRVELRPLVSPVQYFWSRAGVTSQIRQKIETILCQNQT